MRHYRLKGAQPTIAPFLLYEIKIDMQDIRSGYRYSGWGLYLQAPWIDDNEFEWTADMVSRVDPEELEETAPDSDRKWPELADQKMSHYLIKYYRPTAWRNSWLGIFSHAGESEQDFVARCREVVTDRRESELKKIREVFFHRFVELEQRLVRQAEQDELGEAWRDRRVTQIQEVFSGLRENLSRMLLGASRPVGELSVRSVPDAIGAEAKAKCEGLRGEFIAKYNEVLEDYEQQANQIERYAVTLSYSQIEIAARAVLWA